MTRDRIELDGGRAWVDPAARQLQVGGAPAKLGGRAFDLLLALIEHCDRVVPKQELMDLVWPGLVVEENNLQVHVLALRRLLGAQAITTVAGRGYRFALPVALRAGPVVPAASSAPAALAATAGAAADPSEALIGRAALLAAVCDCLGSESTRLVTLTGPGGAGKTRLALRATALLAPALADGAYGVMLAPVRDATHLMAAVAAALGVQEGGAESVASLVLSYLRSREVLLMLDNLEHLPEAAVHVSALLEAAPRLKVLATSRILLHLAAEQEIKVPPLALPASDTPSEVSASPAVQLFAERAAAIGRPLREGTVDWEAAARICRRLDGLPLALELAAARLRVLTPVALAARLQHSLPLLRGGAADAPQRQQTLRDTIAWSHALLDAPARRLLRRLGLFAGGWSLDGAEALDEADSRADREDSTVDRLERLLDHNLVQRLDDLEDKPRYGMLETIREFALEQLALAGETEAMRQRHALHFLALAREGERGLTSAGRMPWLNLLRADINNLRQALHWWLRERPEAPAALALAGAMTWLWYFEGAYREGLGELAAALALPGAEACKAERAATLSGAARLSSFTGDMARGHECARQSIELWRGLGDARGLGFALLHDGVPTLFVEGRAPALAVLREAEDSFQAAADAWGVAVATVYQGVVLAALPGAEEAAAPLLAAGLERCLALGDEWAASTCSGYMGVLAMRRGDLADARHKFERILASARETGDRFRIGRSTHFLGELELAEQRHPEATALLVEALALVIEQGRHGDVPFMLRATGRALAGLGRHADAVRLLALGSRPATVKASLPPDDPQLVQGAVDSCRGALGEAAFDELWAQGQRLMADEALAIAKAHAA